MPKIFHSLKLQIIVAIAVLTALFAASTLYSLHVIDQQHSDDVLVQLAGRVHFNQQHLTVQAMRYRENAPRDYPSYYRDLRLYFEDLKKTRTELDQLITAFANNRFDASLTGRHMAMQPHLPPESHAVAGQLATEWESFMQQFDERIGPDKDEPRLEWAAELIGEQNETLEKISQTLMSTLKKDVEARAQWAYMVNRLLLGAALLVSVGIAVWFYRGVMAPMTTTVEGFKQVANGDFSHRVPVLRNNEIGWLASAFNHLATRMDGLRKLLTRLEQGADLEGTLKTLSETLPPLIPVDWIGVLIIAPGGDIYLEKAYSDGKPEPIGRLRFHPDQTLLEECINTSEPLHIPDVRETSQLSESYVFLRKLAELGRRDAIFLPISNSAGVHGVAVFASRYPNNYRTEHLALLRNLGVLVGISLGRTIQLVENARLATIGQFASGIVHEIRNPLATIGLALEHFEGLDGLPQGAQKRLTLASNEVARLERLLADILLYAKPMTLQREIQDVCSIVSETISADDEHHERTLFEVNPCPPIPVDADRLRQVLINLVNNARQASPPGEPIRISCATIGDSWVEITIANAGEPIPPKTLERVFEPFFTSRTHGTGLGLPISQRIVAAHGGEIELKSDEGGTRAVVRLPTEAGAEESTLFDQAALDAEST